MHELAESLGLKHESKGEGKLREITVSKQIIPFKKDIIITKDIEIIKTLTINEEVK